MAVATSAPTHALALLAAKSWMGHSEPAAGVLGLAHAHMAISQQAVLPVLHLRTLNPHVESSFSTQDSDRRQLAAARQLAPVTRMSREALVCGTSAFAFQGTNAHAIMSVQPAAAAPQSTVRAAVTVPLQRKRYWVAPSVHSLLTSFKAQHAQHSMAMFEAVLTRPAAAYLWDHVVVGRCLMPGAGTFDLACSAARLLTANDDAASTMLVDSTLPQPMLLPQHSTAQAAFTVQVGISIISGQVQVTTAGQQLNHLSGLLRQCQTTSSLSGSAKIWQTSLSQAFLQDQLQSDPQRHNMLIGDLARPADSPVSSDALPAQLDCAFQLGAALTQGRADDHSALRVPVGAQSVALTPAQHDLSHVPSVTAQMHSMQSTPGDGSVTIDFALGRLCSVRRLKAKRLKANASNPEQLSAQDSMLYMMSHPASEPVQATQQSATTQGHRLSLHSTHVMGVYAKGLAAAKAAAALSEKGKPGSLDLRTQGAVSGLLAQPAPCSQTRPALVGLRALVKTLGHEIPNLRCQAMDRHAARVHDRTAGPHATITILNADAQHAQHGSAEQAGVWHTSRLLPLTAAASPVTSGHYQLMPCPHGALTHLTPVSLDPMTPRRGQVLVEVHAVGLNFRDVLNVLGMYPGDPGPPGADCAGVVTATGAGVSGFVKGENQLQQLEPRQPDFLLAFFQLARA